MLLQHRSIGQETRRYGERSFAALRVGHGVARPLARSVRRSEMRRHSIDAPSFKSIAHRSSPLFYRARYLTPLLNLTYVSIKNLTPLPTMRYMSESWSTRDNSTKMPCWRSR